MLTSYERRICSPSRQGFFGLINVCGHAGHLRLAYEGGLGSWWRDVFNHLKRKGFDERWSS